LELELKFGSCVIHANEIERWIEAGIASARVAWRTIKEFAMRNILLALGVLVSSSVAVAQSSPPGLCTRVAYVDQTEDYLVVNGQVRVVKSQANNDYLTAALQDPSLVVCLGTETDIWGNVDVVSVGRPARRAYVR
jgi:hypothetical protein